MYTDGLLTWRCELADPVRWDFRVSPLSQDGLVSGSYPIPDPYNSPTQGTLCGKCHEGGAPSAVGPTGPGPAR